MSNIGIITNPHAKLNKNNPERQKKLQEIAQNQAELRITRDLKELELVAKEFYRKKIDILAIDGGDGTISRTLTVFIKIFQGRPLPTISLLRGGTINVLADNLGVKGKSEKLLRILLDKQKSFQTKNHQTLNSIKIDHNYGFLFANGVCAKFLEVFYEKKTHGIGAISLALKTIFSQLTNGKTFQKINSYNYTEFEFDDFPKVSQHTSAVFCSTLDKITLGIPFFPSELKKRKHFQCISVSTPPEKLALSYILPILISLKNQQKKAFCFSCKSLKVSEENPFLYTLDGELFFSKNNNIRIELGPQINFLK